jgi:cell division septum initiation protein DivIVA
MELKLLKALEKIAELERENRELKKRIEELEKKLRFYESPHLPSSKRILKEKEGAKPPKKRGAPPGHKGATRKYSSLYL